MSEESESGVVRVFSECVDGSRSSKAAAAGSLSYSALTHCLILTLILILSMHASVRPFLSNVRPIRLRRQNEVDYHTD